VGHAFFGPPLHRKTALRRPKRQFSGLPPRSNPNVSLKIALYREGKFRRFISQEKAARKVAAGGFRWNGADAIEQINERFLALRSRPFCSGPGASFTDWRPKPSGGVTVMQLRTHRSSVA
jgi:hypothetical protein